MSLVVIILRKLQLKWLSKKNNDDPSDVIPEPLNSTNVTSTETEQYVIDVNSFDDVTDDETLKSSNDDSLDVILEPNDSTNEPSSERDKNEFDLFTNNIKCFFQKMKKK